MTKRIKKLRSGFTTGACAAAAVKGALFLLVHGKKEDSVNIPFLSEGSVDIKIFSFKEKKGQAICSVIKDAGDDPDITHKAQIGASVTIAKSKQSAIVIRGGKGVGRVTKPGLEIPPGEPAINLGPRKMIQRAVMAVIENFDSQEICVDIEIFVDQGEKLARHTLNQRLGIIGGISILGTTGIVRPMSHDAYIATIQSSLSVARAMGVQTLFFTTGRRSERFAEGIFNQAPKEAFIQVGDFFGKSLDLASKMSFDQIVFVIFFGKAVKMAQGAYHTHAVNSELSLSSLSDWTYARTKDVDFSEKIKKTNTAREAFFMLKDHSPKVILDVSKKILQSAAAYAGSHIGLRSIVLDFNGAVAAQANLDKRGDKP